MLPGLTADDVIAAFDHLAAQHDDARWHGTRSAFESEVERMLAQIASRASGRVLALGGGSGRELTDFVRHGWDCTLVDFSPKMIELAARRLPRQVQLFQADADTFMDDLADASYDVLLAIGELLGYVSAPSATLQKAARILHRRAAFIFTFAETGRCRDYGLEEIARDEFGAVFRERTDPPLCIRALEIADVREWLEPFDAAMIEIRSGSSPRVCVVAARSDPAESCD